MVSIPTKYDQIPGMVQKNYELTSKLEDLARENKNLSESYSVLERSTVSILSENDLLKDQNQKLIQQNEIYEKRLQSLEGEIVVLKSNITRLREETGDVNGPDRETKTSEVKKMIMIIT